MSHRDRVTFLGHEDPEPSNDPPPPAATPQDPYVDAPVPHYLGAYLGPPVIRPVQRRRRTGVIVGALAALVVLVGGGSAIAALANNPEHSGNVGLPAAVESSVSPALSGVQSPVTTPSPTPSPTSVVTTTGAPAAGVPTTAAPAPPPPATTPPVTATTDPEPTGAPTAWPTYPAPITPGAACSFNEIGWIGYDQGGARFVCRRVHLLRPHWVPFPT